MAWLEWLSACLAILSQPTPGCGVEAAPNFEEGGHATVSENPAIDTRLTRKRLLEVTGGVAASAFLASCGSSSGGSPLSTSTVKRRGGELRIVASELFPQDQMDPCKMINIGETLAGGHVLEGLTRVQLGDFKVIPVLAESWEHNAAFTEWTFHIRQGVTFHNGKPLTAADAAWSLKRNLVANIGSAQYSRLSATLRPEGVIVTDPQTLTLKMFKPDSNILYPLGQYETWIVPEGTTNFDAGIGTGPFKVESFVPGDHWQLSRNPRYWQSDLPYLDSISLRHVQEPSTRVQSVLAGQADLTQTQPSLLKLSNGNPAAYLVVAKQIELYNVAMNSTAAPFDDNRVRMAMKLGLDRSRLIQLAYSGHAVPTADTVVASNNATYFPAALQSQLRQNVSMSNQLLSEAGFPNGLNVELQTDNEPGLQTFGLAFADAMSASKIKVDVKIHPSATYWSQEWLKADFFVSDWYARQPLEALSQQFASNSSENEPQFKSPQLDDLILKAFGSGGATQQKYVQQALTLVGQNSGDVIPAYLDFLWVTARGVTGLDPRPDVQIYAGAASKA
jgi:peptide/nickel transport system substrate-binding protein